MLKPFELTDAGIADVRKSAEKHPLELGKTELGSRIAHAMRSACHVSGDDWDKFMTVLLRPGESVDGHKHKRHTILYYPEGCEVMATEEIIICPGRGTMIYIAPEIWHSVPTTKDTRLSVAMLVSESSGSGGSDGS